LAWRRGFSITEDPLLSSILTCLQTSYYQQLKSKSRIFVEDSANLLGVVDSKGLLAPHEVFIKIKKNNFRKRKNFEDDTTSQIVSDILRCKARIARQVHEEEK